jgi:2-polyprenyl-3-methyl-5-hydroxy-6-metoxy-1,4-benzoquinol methylase
MNVNYDKNAGHFTGAGPGVQGLAPRRCLLCGDTRQDVVFQEFGIDILRCRHCRHVFSSYPGDPHYEGFWGDEVPQGEQYYWQKARARMHRDFVGRFVAGRSGRLLDMGCGLGYFLKVIESQANWEGYGREVSETAVRYARETLGLRNVARGRLEDADLPEASFDIVTMWDVIDHVLRPDPLLKRCHALLKEGGICFIRTPNAAVQLFRARLRRLARGMQPGLPYLQARDHMHHYSADSIRRLLERNGFHRVEFVHLHPVESASGERRVLARTIKNTCFEAVRAVAIASGGRLNIDNLFVVARKGNRAGALSVSPAARADC